MSRSTRRRSFALLAGPALALACGEPAKSPSSKTVMAKAAETWCPEKLSAGPGDTCFAIPKVQPKDAPVLVYLHGPFKGSPSDDEMRVLDAALDRGYAVVVPRGKRAHCALKAELKDQYCWPTDPEDPAAMKAAVAEWDRAIFQVDALLEPGAHKHYVLGYDAGGSFAAFIATKSLLPAQAFAIVGGELLAPPDKPEAPEVKEAKPAKGAKGAKVEPVRGTPILLTGSSDDRDVADRVHALHEGLSAATWTHAYCPRPGARSLSVDDMEAALGFFKREADGTLKPQMGAYPCETTKAK